ncbi:hypothetical protein GQ42DRAFT_162358, partial [Ramicandelaber brevisporus]
MSDTINIKLQNGSTIAVQVDLAEGTVEQLKQLVHEKVPDAPPEAQRLIYAGRMLKDQDQLKQYKIVSGHQVHMV